MTNINIQASINDDAINEIALAVMEEISTSDLAVEVENYIDYDKIIDNVASSYYFEDMISSKIDDIAEETYSRVDSHIESLLNDYNPSSYCSMGQRFTSAIKDAVTYLFHNDDSFKHLAPKIEDDDSSETSSNEVTEESKVVGIFNEDLVALYEVVDYLVHNYSPDMKNDLLKVQMDMWVKFVMARTTYTNSLKEGTND